MYKLSPPPPLRRLKLSRSLVDATRFTAAAPHAYPNLSAPISSSESSQPSQRSTEPSSPSRIPRRILRFPKIQFPRSPAPSTRTETPVQKVARLRAERAVKRAAEITLWDRIVLRGRVVADIVHRAAVRFLFWSTGASCFSTYYVHLRFNWLHAALPVIYATRSSSALPP